MSDKQREKDGLSRRDLLGGSAKAATLAGLGAAATATGVAGFTAGSALRPTEVQAADAAKGHVGPGDLDDYYATYRVVALYLGYLDQTIDQRIALASP